MLDKLKRMLGWNKQLRDAEYWSTYYQAYARHYRKGLEEQREMLDTTEYSRVAHKSHIEHYINSHPKGYYE